MPFTWEKEEKKKKQKNLFTVTSGGDSLYESK